MSPFGVIMIVLRCLRSALQATDHVHTKRLYLSFGAIMTVLHATQIGGRDCGAFML